MPGMSEGPPDDPTKRLMPWETGGEQPPADATPTEVVPTAPPPAEPTPPEPAATEPPPAATEPAPVQPAELTPVPPGEPPAPEAAPAPTAGLISAAPVGWDPNAAAPGAPPPTSEPAQVGWGTPETGARPVPGAPGFVFADTPSRFVGWIIDLFIVGFIGGLIASVASVGMFSTVSSDNLPDYRGTVALGLAFWGISLLVNLLYFVFFWTGGRRATPGQRLMKIQVGNAHDGRNLDLSQAAVRWVGYGEWIIVFSFAGTTIGGIALLAALIWPFVLLFTTIMSPTKQGLHDRLAGTWLVKPAGASSSGVARGCLLIVGLIVVFWFLSLIGLIFLGGQMSTILSSVGESI